MLRVFHGSKNMRPLPVEENCNGKLKTRFEFLSLKVDDVDNLKAFSNLPPLPKGLFAGWCKSSDSGGYRFISLAQLMFL